jgi:hypothetical protein
MPSTLWPPNHRLVDVQTLAKAEDLCSPVTVLLHSVTSDEPDDATNLGDGTTANDIQGAELGTADFGLKLRAERAGTGDGRTYSVIYAAVDASGNRALASSRVFVPHDQHGVTEPVIISARESSTGTILDWTQVAGALYYTVVRGNIKQLAESEDFNDLGPVVCVEASSIESSTGEREDSDLPSPGDAFYYVVAYSDGFSSTYGSVSAEKPRRAGAGDCR